MKVVFFGDSNTWGFDPHTGMRQPDRFTEQIRKARPEWEIVEEGLNGRTLSNDDPFSAERNGARQISSTIRSQAPYDVLVVMLGTNDAKRIFGMNEHMLERALFHFLDAAADPSLFRRSPYQPGKILLVQTPALHPDAFANLYTAANFGKEGKAMLEHSHAAFQHAADLYGLEWMPTDGSNGKEAITGGPTDGIHLESLQHTLLARQLLDVLDGLEADKNRKDAGAVEEKNPQAA